MDSIYPIIDLRDRPELIPQAAAWFHEKWRVPLSAYEESMRDALTAGAYPRWYAALDGEKIIAGLGVIENDFHYRPDLAPNVCAVYTEPDYRCRGLAGTLLGRVCADMKSVGFPTLYLITDHTSFYERYGWRFLCPVQCDGCETSRMYIHEN